MLLLLLHTDPSGATAAAPAAVDNVAASILSHLLPFLLAPLVGERSCSVSKHMLLLLLLQPRALLLLPNKQGSNQSRNETGQGLLLWLLQEVIPLYHFNQSTCWGHHQHRLLPLLLPKMPFGRGSCCCSSSRV